MEYNLYISDKPNKRLMIKYINPKTLRENTIYFGDSKGENYTMHHNDEKKLNYIKRHSVREDHNNLSTAGAWSRWLLWEEKTLQKSIKKMERLYNIKIIDNVLDEKPSAYRSMKLANLGLAKKSDSSSKLLNWTEERWQNLTAKLTDNKFYDCGTKGKIQEKLGLPSVCRPSKRINEKTPKKLASQYSDREILEAIKIKNRGSRINWSNL